MSWDKSRDLSLSWDIGVIRQCVAREVVVDGLFRVAVGRAGAELQAECGVDVVLVHVVRGCCPLQCLCGK